MKNINITVSKDDVLEEVGRTTAYIGSKKVENKKEEYERISTTEADGGMLERFWMESCDALVNLLRRFVASISSSASEGKNFELTLSMSDRFDTNLVSSINSSAFSFFVNSIIAKWSEITNKQESSEYANNATAMLQDIKTKVFTKVKPTRNSIS